tara:strand:+ start:1261 stop:1812 length:552 start_codon:yes stop_codon:yes gene_type:complete
LKFIETSLKGAFIIKPEAYEDRRGVFERIFCEKEFKEINHSKKLVQINCSLTNRKGSVRGMHYQIPPMTEIKIVKCLRGSVYDVIIDLRKGSDTFLKWHGETLSNENRRMIYIPEGFAHGFQALERNCELLYFHTEFYSPDYERAIRFDDPKVGIKWLIDVTETSERDRNHPLLSENYKGILL